jgi:hypothetical protein
MTDDIKDLNNEPGKEKLDEVSGGVLPPDGGKCRNCRKPVSFMTFKANGGLCDNCKNKQ